MNELDKAKEIRKGEELNIENLELFLNEKLGTSNQKLLIQQFPGGYSNLTYLLKLGETELVLRRPPFGAENISKGHDMGREFKVLSLLQPHYAKSPKPIAYTEDLDIIGTPFYVMERVQGIIIRQGQKIDFQSDIFRKMNENFIHNFADLHRLDIHQTGLINLGKPEGYLERQVNGWIQRYQKVQTEEIPNLNFALQWLSENLPQSPSPTFIHNDYKFDNVILDDTDNTQIKAVLDWEMSTVGDPLTDLGILLGYLVEKNDPPEMTNFGLGYVEGSLTRQEFVACYEEELGKKASNLVYYYAFALVKLAVIAQQIYYRYHQGFSKDERFAKAIGAVRNCALMAARAIKENRISNF